MTHFETLLQNSKGGSIHAGAVKLIYYQTKSPLRFLVRNEITLKMPRTPLTAMQSHFHEINS
jgi:hypothetical protein